jgi:hypothetical protein
MFKPQKLSAYYVRKRQTEPCAKTETVSSGKDSQTVCPRSLDSRGVRTKLSGEPSFHAAKFAGNNAERHTIVSA